MAEFDIYRILAQSRPSSTSATTAYTKPSKQIATVFGIVVCNTTGSAITFSVYVCKNGTTYDQTTAILYTVALAANETQYIMIPVTLDTTSGTIGVQTSTSNAINFTILGKIKEYN